MTTHAPRSSPPANRADFTLALEEHGHVGFDVVRFESHEALGELFRYDVWLARPIAAPSVAAPSVLGKAATFVIRTEIGHRKVHGIVELFEEVEETSTLALFRIRIVPHLALAGLRTHTRTFVDRSLSDIVRHVLEDRTPGGPRGGTGLVEIPLVDPPDMSTPTSVTYEVPVGHYAIDVKDRRRFDDVALRGYVVQYNETDLDFLRRLLEEEGLTFFFVHTAAADVLVVGDAPDEGRFQVLALRQGVRGDRVEEAIRTLSRTTRLSVEAVAMRDFDPARPLTELEGVAVEPEGARGTRRQLFPARDEAVTVTPGLTPASTELQRAWTEAQLVSGKGTVRTMSPGARFQVEDLDGARAPECYLAVSVRQAGTQLVVDGAHATERPVGISSPQTGPAFECAFTVLPTRHRFVPRRSVPSPRVAGVHTALVTAEEVSTDTHVHCDAEGRVRVRFPWDTRVEPGAPSSCWIRVSQAWAGAGYGFFALPRVGHEVLVAYLQGDPERPVIVGRVHDASEPQPYLLPEHKTVTTWRSQSSPFGAGYNELRFDDALGEEQVYLQAERNLDELIKASRSTSVGGDHTSGVGGDQTITVGATRRVRVAGDHVMESENLSSLARGEHAFTSPRALFRQGSLFRVACPEVRFVEGGFFGVETGILSQRASQAFSVETLVGSIEASAALTLEASGARIEMSGGNVKVSNGAGASIVLAGSTITIDASRILLKGGAIELVGGSIDATATLINLNH